MKNRLLNSTLIAASLLLTAGYANIAAAHSVSGTLGRAAGATDLYYANCSDDGNGTPYRLATRILDKAPVVAAKVSAQTVRGFKATSTTDAVDANAAYSPIANNLGGSGDYVILVNKSAAGAESYDLEAHCYTANGLHTGTVITGPFQDQ